MLPAFADSCQCFLLSAIESSPHCFALIVGVLYPIVSDLYSTESVRAGATHFLQLFREATCRELSIDCTEKDKGSYAGTIAGFRETLLDLKDLLLKTF